MKILRQIHPTDFLASNTLRFHWIYLENNKRAYFLKKIKHSILQVIYLKPNLLTQRFRSFVTIYITKKNDIFDDCILDICKPYILFFK